MKENKNPEQHGPLSDFDLMALYAEICVSDMADQYMKRQYSKQQAQETGAGDGNIRVLKVEPGKVPEAVTVPNTLEALQAVVGGYIETVGLDANALLVCNEEGKLLGLPANRQVAGDIIAGTFLVVGSDDGEFCSLADADMAHYAEQFAQPMPLYGSPDEPTQWEFHVF